MEASVNRLNGNGHLNGHPERRCRPLKSRLTQWAGYVLSRLDDPPEEEVSGTINDNRSCVVLSVRPVGHATASPAPERLGAFLLSPYEMLVVRAVARGAALA